jgi:hypothetical protein
MFTTLSELSESQVIQTYIPSVCSYIPFYSLTLILLCRSHDRIIGKHIDYGREIENAWFNSWKQQEFRAYSETAALLFETILSPSQRFMGGWGVDLTAYCNQRRVCKWMELHLWSPIRLNVVLYGNVTVYYTIIKPWLQSKLAYLFINFSISSRLFIMFHYVQFSNCVMEMTVI